MTAEFRLAALVEKVTGIAIGERDLPRLRKIAGERAQCTGHTDLRSYVEALRKAPDGPEWREILGRITVNESSLFRGPRQFAALAQSVVHNQLALGRPTIRIWSAGCARGEEPATIAVVLAETEALRGYDWRILATDVDEEALEKAKTSTFSRRAIRKVPTECLARYFVDRGDDFQLIEKLRKRIDYRYFNLVHTPWLVPEGPFDAIFLRNVLIYFSKEAQARVVATIAPHLARGGCLFVGPSESLRTLAPQFLTRDFGDCFAYMISRENGSPSPDDRETRIPDAAAERVRDGGGRETVHQAPSRAILALEKGDFTAAEFQMREFPMAPDDPVGHAICGILAEKAGRLDDAVRAFRAATYLDMTLFQVRFMMARCLALSGWAERARIEMRALSELLSMGEGKPMPWADRLGLPTREEVSRMCGNGLAGLADHKVRPG